MNMVLGYTKESFIHSYRAGHDVCCAKDKTKVRGVSKSLESMIKSRDLRVADAILDILLFPYSIKRDRVLDDFVY